MSKVNTPAQKFTLSEQTKNIFKEYAGKTDSLKKALAKVRGNAFIYGFEGGTTSKRYTQKQRYYLSNAFDMVACLIEETAKGKPDVWRLINTRNSINEPTISGAEIGYNTYLELLKTGFDITTHWVSYATNDLPYTPEIIAAWELWDWLITVSAFLWQDREEYDEACTAKA